MKTLFLCIANLFLYFVGISQTLNIGLLACYSFAGNANDQSGNAHHGLVNGPVLTSDRFNIPGYAYSYDGVDDYIDIGLFSDFTNSNDFSISVWIQPNQVKLQTILMLHPDNFSDRFNAMAYYSHNGVSTTIWDYGNCTAGGRLIYVGTTFSPAWQHWVYAISQGNGMKVYINGVLHLAQPGNSQLVNRNRNLWIGGGIDVAGAPFYFDGKIDDMRLYDRELTPLEIQTLYGLELMCIPTALPDAFVNKNLFKINTNGNTVRVKVDHSATESQLNLFSVDGKALFSRKQIQGGDEFEVNLKTAASGIVMYSFNTAAGIVSGKLFLNH